MAWAAKRRGGGKGIRECLMLLPTRTVSFCCIEGDGIIYVLRNHECSKLGKVYLPPSIL